MVPCWQDCAAAVCPTWALVYEHELIATSILLVLSCNLINDLSIVKLFKFIRVEIVLAIC